jgi:hypothetical protein
MGVIEDGALLGGPNQHRAGTSALGPRAFQNNAIAPVCVTRLEQDAFLSPQTECLLQPSDSCGRADR